MFWNIDKSTVYFLLKKINTREKFSNEPSAKINTHEIQFFSKEKLLRKLEQAKISTIKV